MNSKFSTQAEFVIAESLRAYVDAALTRLGYLFPEWDTKRSSDGVIVELPDGVPEAQARREILHAVYREKIYAETLNLRHGLLDLVRRP